jgi:hypothetical protein
MASPPGGAGVGADAAAEVLKAGASPGTQVRATALPRTGEKGVRLAQKMQVGP